ncbi:MAG: SpoIID/LytB domain-containing protein, partial [Bryobacteraceae bacterium]
QYRGTLKIHPARDRLIAVVSMDLETAVASVTAAESGPGAPREELKAQAVLARSFFLAAGPRHPDFAFCDTTHCQLLREAPAAGSGAALADEQTRGLVLTYRGRVFPPLYSSNCGGRTRLLGDVGLRVEIYPYFAVKCVRAGPPRGHGVGLCQTGATAMAHAGATYRAILNHYYPATLVRQK